MADAGGGGGGGASTTGGGGGAVTTGAAVAGAGGVVATSGGSFGLAVFVEGAVAFADGVTVGVGVGVTGSGGGMLARSFAEAVEVVDSGGLFVVDLPCDEKPLTAKSTIPIVAIAAAAAMSQPE